MFCPIFSPEITASGGSLQRCESAMFTQSAGVPETVLQSKPKNSRSSTRSSEWRLYALPIQLCSRDGTTMQISQRAAMAPGTPLDTMGAAGRTLVEAEFSWVTSAARMQAVFDELRHGAGAGTPSDA